MSSNAFKAFRGIARHRAANPLYPPLTKGDTGTALQIHGEWDNTLLSQRGPVEYPPFGKGGEGVWLPVNLEVGS